MAKKTKEKAAKPPVAMTPAKKAYAIAIDALKSSHDEYSNGQANDEDFTTPGKQVRVAKQIAKMHNRLLKKSKLDGLELDED